MDAQTVTTIISTVGFPIAACVALFWYLRDQTKAHKEEMGELKKAIDNNTMIITKLYERLAGHE